MLYEIIKVMTIKSIAKKSMIKAMKNGQNGDVVKEKLGVDTIDEFMKMDIHDYQKKKGMS